MKLLIKLSFFFLPILVLSQENETIYKVTYDQYIGEEIQEEKISIIYKNGIVFLTQPDDKIQRFIDFNQEYNVSIIMHNDTLYKDITKFDELPEPNFNTMPDTILGYLCQYASYSYFSNSIEVWYTEETHAKGSPYSKFVPNTNALVLRVIINGNRIIIANSINIIDEVKKAYKADEAKKVSKSGFEEIKINSRFTRLPIFEDEVINFNPDIKPMQGELQNGQTYHFSKGSVIMKKISLSENQKNSGHIFVKLNCRSNGDAYDRTGSVFFVLENESKSILNAYQNGLDILPVYFDNEGESYQGIIRTGNYETPIEIMRFFTSFGAGHFNEKREIRNYNWESDVIYKQEVTSLFPSDQQEIWVGVFIGNYDNTLITLTLIIEINR